VVYRKEATGIVAPDGSLTINQAIDAPPGRHRVELLIEETPIAPAPLDWPSFIKATFGSLADIPIMRESEGDGASRRSHSTTLPQIPTDESVRISQTAALRSGRTTC
jgi:hypothetical protein